MINVVGSALAGVPVADMRSMSVDGTRRHLTAKCLTNADFAGCVVDGQPCEHAKHLNHAGFDVHLLGCSHHHGEITPEQAAACTFTPPKPPPV